MIQPNILLLLISTITCTSLSLFCTVYLSLVFTLNSFTFLVTLTYLTFHSLFVLLMYTTRSASLYLLFTLNFSSSQSPSALTFHSLFSSVLTLSLSHTLSLFLPHTLSLSLSFSYTLSLSLTLSLPLSHTRTVFFIKGYL